MERAIQAFLTDLRYGQGRTPNTLAAYRADLAQFATVVAQLAGDNPEAGTPTVNQIEAYVSWLKAQAYRESTVARKMAAVRSFIRFAWGSQGTPPDALMGRLTLPSSADSHKTRILSHDEVGALLDAPAAKGRPRDLRDSAILAVLYATGIRAEQAVELRTFDVDLAGGSLRVKGEAGDKPLDMACEPLRIYLEESRPQLAAGPEVAALFLNQRGGPLSRQGLWLVVKRWAEAVGLKSSVSPHTLRRSRAEHLLQQGWRKRDVQRLLGLTSPNTLRSVRAQELDEEEEPPNE